MSCFWGEAGLFTCYEQQADDWCQDIGEVRVRDHSLLLVLRVLNVQRLWEVMCDSSSTCVSVCSCLFLRTYGRHKCPFCGFRLQVSSDQLRCAVTFGMSCLLHPYVAIELNAVRMTALRQHYMLDLLTKRFHVVLSATVRLYLGMCVRHIHMSSRPASYLRFLIMGLFWG